MKILKKRLTWEQRLGVSSWRVMDSVGQWLEPYPWELFTTETFFEKASNERAFKCHQDFLRSLGKKVFHFTVLERNSAEGVHLHSLLYGIENKPNWDYGRLDVKRYDPKKGARFYLGKSFTNHSSEWDFNLPEIGR